MTDDEPLMPDAPLSMRVDRLKKQLRQAITDYRLAYDADYPCGASMQAYLRPGVSSKARRINELAHELRELDVNFPTDWVDIPTGAYR